MRRFQNPTEETTRFLRYFADDVLRQQPEPVQHIVLRAPVPQTPSAGVADHVLGLEV